MCVWTDHTYVDRRRCGQQARPPTSFVDSTIDFPWRNWDEIPGGGVPLFFIDIRISLKHSV